MTDYHDNAKPSWFSTGQRIETHPATDAWMRGDRFGTVTVIGRKYVSIKMDVSKRTLRMLPSNIGLSSYTVRYTRADGAAVWQLHHTNT